MGQVFHGSAAAAEAVRRAIQCSQESLRTLASQHGINRKTAAKSKRRAGVSDLPTGPIELGSTVLSQKDEAVIAAFRKHTLLPIDDFHYALQATIPYLAQSALRRCLQRHGIGQPPQIEGDKPVKDAFKAYPIGYFSIDFAEVQTAEGKLYLSRKLPSAAMAATATTSSGRGYVKAYNFARRFKPYEALDHTSSFAIMGNRTATVTLN